ncbi:hypothetical protein SHIRM173S_00983 [Streptomyces hirsutus]
MRLLLDGLADHWSLDGLTHHVYGVPKVQAGFPADATPKELPAEIKTAQRSFFALLYLVGRDTGPRLPTLLLAVGQDGYGGCSGTDRHSAAHEDGAPGGTPGAPSSCLCSSVCSSACGSRA